MKKMEFEKIIKFLQENNVKFLIVNSSELIKKEQEKKEEIINENSIEPVITSIQELILVLKQFCDNPNIKNIYELCLKFISK
jgi:hypothetical protein